ncbi:hypothetical protein ACIHCQ_22480 [Streptomyces sp. NPDC052236]|uniref:hypothetical protein n=1 Tax=Streptomyces sp. NPDC052236 TaxID=3365686 RepID=UPI0037D4A853
MRISISQILDLKLRIVEFSGPAGSAWGYWRGSTEPRVGEYNVEFDIPELVTSWHVAGGPDLIEGDFSQREVTLRGSVQSVGDNDDAVVAIRIDLDIVLVEVGDGIPVTCIGESIEFTVPNISLYPYSI